MNLPIAIYALLDSDKKVRYVGRSIRPDGRFNDHRKTKSWATNYIILEWADIKNWIERERFWIAFYRQQNTLVNIADGGQGHSISRETRLKMSLAHAGKPKSLEAIRNQLLSRRNGKGWVVSEEQRQKLRIAHLGKICSEETRLKMKQGHATQESRTKKRVARLGKKLSEETKVKIRQSIIKSRQGRPWHSSAAIEKMRTARLINPIRVWLNKKLPESMRENMKKAWIIRKASKGELR